MLGVPLSGVGVKKFAPSFPVAPPVPNASEALWPRTITARGAVVCDRAGKPASVNVTVRLYESTGAFEDADTVYVRVVPFVPGGVEVESLHAGSVTGALVLLLTTEQTAFSGSLKEPVDSMDTVMDAELKGSGTVAGEVELSEAVP